MVTSVNPRITSGGRIEIENGLLAILEKDEKTRSRALATLRNAIGTSRVNLARLRAPNNSFNVEHLGRELSALGESLATAAQVKNRLMKLNPDDTGIKVIDQVTRALTDEQNVLAVRMNNALKEYAIANKGITALTSNLGKGRKGVLLPKIASKGQ